MIRSNRRLAVFAITLVLSLASACATVSGPQLRDVTIVFMEFRGETVSLFVDDAPVVSGALPVAGRVRGLSYSMQMRIPARSTFRLIVNEREAEQVVELKGESYVYIFPTMPSFVELSMLGPEFLD